MNRCGTCASALHRLDPTAKIVFLGCFILVAMMALDPAFIGCMLFFAFAMRRIGRVPTDLFRGLAKPLLAAFAMFFLLGITFSKPLPGEGVAFYAIPPGLVPVTATGVLVGLANGLRIVAIVWMATVAAVVTPTPDLLSALAEARVPPDLAIAVSISLLYVPVAESAFRALVEAQKSRAARLEYRNPMKRFLAHVPLALPALRIASLRCRDIAWGIEARGFTGRPRAESGVNWLKADTADWVVMACSLAALVVVGYLRLGRGWLGHRFTYELIRSTLGVR